MRKTKEAKKNPYAGGSFDEFLKEEGIFEAVRTTVMKRILAMELVEAMKARNLNKVEMAQRMRCSRPQLDRLLDHHNDSVTLATLCRAAEVVGCELHLELV